MSGLETVSCATGSVRTVLGDVPPGSLGAVNTHEHAFQVSPLLPDDELDDPTLIEEELVDLRRSGFDTMVDATPVGLGRRSQDLAELAERAGLCVVATTGRHRDAHYTNQAQLLEVDADWLTRVFLTELLVGLPVVDADESTVLDNFAETVRARHRGQSVRAGVLKAGIDYWQITPAEHQTLLAVAAAHRQTGAPVMVHLEWGSAAHEVLDVLSGQGVPEERVLLAHVDRTPDPGLHTALAERGALLGYDGAGRLKDWPDSVLVDCLADVVEAGHGAAITLAADVARRRRYRCHGGLPGLAYLGDRFVPRVAERIGPSALEQILRGNPARWLTWSVAVEAASTATGDPR